LANLVVHGERNPPRNLAVEEALLRSVCRGSRGTVARVWFNSTSIIIGRTLGYCEEVDCKAAEKLGVGVYRRITGGGAVYHDEGNINVTVIWPSRGRAGVDEVYRRGTGIVLRALEELGLEGWVENVSDVVIEGWKVSGSAAYVSPCASMFHATLLVDADLDAMRALLKPRLDRVARGEVTPAKYNPNNLRDIAGVSVGEAVRGLRKALEAVLGGLEETLLTGEEAVEAHGLYRAKYSRDEWNRHGRSTI
jgi:lipoate-protein ligase A